MKKYLYLYACSLCYIVTSCTGGANKNQPDTDTIFVGIADSIAIEQVETNVGNFDASLDEIVVKKAVPKFTIVKRENEFYDEYTPRPRYHVRTPKRYNEEELELIADSLVRKELNEGRSNQLWVNYYLPNNKIKTSLSYGLSIRIPSEKSSILFHREETRKLGYQPPKARDLSNANKRECQIWGAFDSGMIAGYEAGYKDGRRNNLYKSFDSSYPSSDEWIEQSYIQGYEAGYLKGYDDAGGDR